MKKISVTGHLLSFWWPCKLSSPLTHLPRLDGREKENIAKGMDRWHDCRCLVCWSPLQGSTIPHTLSMPNQYHSPEFLLVWWIETSHPVNLFSRSVSPFTFSSSLPLNGNSLSLSLSLHFRRQYSPCLPAALKLSRVTNNVYPSSLSNPFPFRAEEGNISLSSSSSLRLQLPCFPGDSPYLLDQWPYGHTSTATVCLTSFSP